MKRTAYAEYAEQFLQLLTLAKETIKQATDLSPIDRSDHLDFAKEIENLITDPEPQFRKVTSLRYLESDFLTYWNEAEGQHINAFWAAVGATGLPFARKNLFAVVLRRGKIADIHEYNQITDGIVVKEQEGRLKRKDLERLKAMLAAFEEEHCEP